MFGRRPEQDANLLSPQTEDVALADLLGAGGAPGTGTGTVGGAPGTAAAPPPSHPVSSEQPQLAVSPPPAPQRVADEPPPSDQTHERNGAPPASTAKQVIDMVTLALEGKAHAELLCRYPVARMLTKTWQKCFAVVDPPTLLVFRQKEDFTDYMFNPYLDQEVREHLLKKKIDIDGSIACSPIQTKQYKGVHITHFRLYSGDLTLLKLGGQEETLQAVRNAINAQIAKSLSTFSSSSSGNTTRAP